MIFSLVLAAVIVCDAVATIRQLALFRQMIVRAEEVRVQLEL